MLSEAAPTVNYALTAVVSLGTNCAVVWQGVELRIVVQQAAATVAVNVTPARKPVATAAHWQSAAFGLVLVPVAMPVILVAPVVVVLVL